MASSDPPASPEALAGRVAAAFGELPQVEAVALAGSRLTGAIDNASDIDLYVYAAQPVPLEHRDAIAAPFASHAEVGNTYWEPGDEWIDAGTGVHVDVMFRTPAWIEEHLERVLVRHEASLGYSTCFWHNVLRSTPLFDRTGWYARLQSWADRPYPEELKRAIVGKNYPVLAQALSSYRHQIERAVRRGDGVGVQHRVTALLASYFNILLAVNELPHPGEKGLLPFVTSHCRLLPANTEAAVNALLEIPSRPPTLAILQPIEALVTDLDALLAHEGMPANRSAN